MLAAVSVARGETPYVRRKIRSMWLQSSVASLVELLPAVGRTSSHLNKRGAQLVVFYVARDFPAFKHF